MPAEFYSLLFCLASLAGLPFFFGFSIKHLVLASSQLFFFGAVLGALLLLAMVFGLLYSARVLYYVFFDSRKARKSVYLACASAKFKSYYYSNTTPAVSFSIGGLIFSSVLILCLFSFYAISDYNLSILGGEYSFGYPLSAQLAELDKGLSFNFKLLNIATLVLFFFMSFFK